MTKREICFSVVNGDKCASVWKIKTNKNSPDVYLSSNSLGTIHASMHKDGRWHIKYGKIEEKIETSIDQEVIDEYLEKWQRPSETKPRITIAFHIHTPNPTPHKKKRLITKPFFEIPNAPTTQSTEITILFVAPNTELHIKNANLISKLDLSNGEMVVVIYKYVPIKIPDNLKDQLKIPDFTSKISLFDLLRGRFGLVFFGKTSTETRVLWDIALHISIKRRLKIIFKKLLSYTRN